MATVLHDRGTPVTKLHLVDNDVMALGSAVSLARVAGFADLVEVHLRDIFRQSLSSFLEPRSVDVVDLLGLIDYFPTELRSGSRLIRPVERLLAQVREITRPGGIILVGNMLNCRPQQQFFEKVWPALHQRSVRVMLDIFGLAGYERRQVQVRIPAHDGIYAVYGLVA
jgi:SAM-dependent methyltransferase